MRKDICSMTVSGLVMPPVQNSSQSLSILLRRGPVIMVCFCSMQWCGGSRALSVDGETLDQREHRGGVSAVGKYSVEAIDVDARERLVVRFLALDATMLEDV